MSRFMDFFGEYKFAGLSSTTASGPLGLLTRMSSTLLCLKKRLSRREE